MPKIHSSFVLDNLEFLHKGGRCSSVAKFGANVLGLKPVIGVDPATGKMDVIKNTAANPKRSAANILTTPCTIFQRQTLLAL